MENWEQQVIQWKLQLGQWIELVALNINPWIAFVSTIAVLFTAWKTLSGKVVTKDEKTGLDLLRIGFRRWGFVVVLSTLLLSTILLTFASIFVRPDLPLFWYPEFIAGQYILSYTSHWYLYATSIVSYITLSLYWHRSLKPKLVERYRKITVKKSDDEISDITKEAEKNQPIDFDPRDYYKEGYFFMGMDEAEHPIYISDSEFAKKHAKIIGPTQVGKGVGLGVLIDQSIKKGWSTWFNDIKPDDFIYHIMKQACDETGRSIKYIDLNGSYGTYEPFKQGSKREREERVVKACRLDDKGTSADFHMANNRGVLSYLMESWDGTLTHLQQMLSGEDDSIPSEKQEWVSEKGVNLKSRISEFAKLDALRPSNNRDQFNVHESMQAGDVVYIRGHMKDKLVRSANVALLDEFIQLGLKKQQNKHIFFVLDEARFLATDSLADSLATLLSKNINMAISYQAKYDLHNLPDASLNAKSISNGVETNTNITYSYRTNDEETARWVAGMTGTCLKNITTMEGVDKDKFGSEKWTGKKMYGNISENYITPNAVLSFPARVGLLLSSGSLATIIKTCWIPVDHFSDLPEEEAPTYTNRRRKKVSVINHAPVAEETSDKDKESNKEKEQEKKDVINNQSAELFKQLEESL